MSNRFKLFTIIELLVVVSILAILISLLQPTLSSMFENGRLIVCSSNLKTQYLAVDYYAEDHQSIPHARDWFPGAYDWEPSARLHASKSWEYVENVDLYICPTFRMVNDSLPNRKKVKSFSYALNWFASRNPKTFFDFQHPSQMALISEENPFVIDGLYRHSFNDGFIYVGPWNPVHIDGIATFHNASSYNSPEPRDGFANVLFIDGHVGLGDINQLNEVMRDIPIKN